MPEPRWAADHWHRLGWQVLEIFVAEVVGTALLLFFGCMGMVRFNPEVPLPPLQGAIVFAVVVATLVQIFGHISLAHLNPAVTICFVLLGVCTPGMAVVYFFAEMLGAVLGYLLLIVLTSPEALSLSPGLCCTVPHPGLTALQALAMEVLATGLLIIMICAVVDPRNADKTDSTPLKFGAVIFALSTAVGPYTGASLNPVRSFAPAMWTGVWTDHWVYWLGPCLGAVTATIFYQAMFSKRQEEITSGNEDVFLNQVEVVTQQKTSKEKESS